MHICFLTNEYPKAGFPHGGIGTSVRSLAEGLIERGHRLSVVGINYDSTEEVERNGLLEIHRLPRFGIPGIAWFIQSGRINKRLREIHRSNPIDIVEGAENSLAFIKKFPGPKFAIRCHGGHHFFSDAEGKRTGGWRVFQEKRSFRKADVVFGVSEYVLNKTAEFLEFSEKRGPVIPNPVDATRFAPREDISSIEDRILFFGTVCEKKGIRQLVQAMETILKERPKAELHVVGRDWKYPDGRSYTAELKSETPQNIIRSIKFLGPVPNDELPKMIAEAHICVLPSHMEAMPLAWLEVLSMGKSFVASKTGPGLEVVRHGETGLLCDPYSPSDIAEKILSVLSNSQRANKLGESARKDILVRFDLPVVVERYIEFYENLLGDKQGQATASRVDS